MSEIKSQEFNEMPPRRSLTRSFTNTSIATDPRSISHHHQYRSTKMRYVALAQYSLLAFLNGILWIIFSNIVHGTKSFYNISSYQVDNLSSCYYYCFLLSCFPAIAFVDKYGVKNSVMVSSLLNLTSAGMKLISALFFPNYIFVFISQCLAGVSQSFFLPIPPALSLIWFGDEQRTIATTIASIANPLGGAAGLLIAPMFVNHEHHDKHAFTSLFTFVTIVGALDFSLILMVIPGKPKHSPSEAAHIRRHNEYLHKDVSIKERIGRIWEETKPFVKDTNTLALLIGGGVAAGSFWAFSTLLAQITEPFDVKQDTVGLMGFLATFAGLPFGLFISSIVDHLRVYKPTLLGAVSMLIVLNGLFTLFLYCFPEGAVYHIFPMTILLGLFQNLILPITFEAAAETTFPLSENIVGTLVLCGSEICALIFSNVLPQLLDSNSRSPKMSAVIVCSVLTLVNIVAFFIILYGKVELKRLRAHTAEDTDSESEADDTDDQYQYSQ